MSERQKSGWRFNRNRGTAAALLLVVTGMVGLSFAAVPLYQMFCQVTGYGGTTQRVAAADVPAASKGRLITVTFDTNVARGMPWSFTPPGKVSIHPGEEQLVIFQAKNTADHAVTGTATFNVTPYKAGSYFSKVQCFCFTEQVLQPGETGDMPVQFFVDPEILTDPNTRDVSNIVLSYTFYPKQETSEVKGKTGRPKG